MVVVVVVEVVGAGGHGQAVMIGGEGGPLTHFYDKELLGLS